MYAHVLYGVIFMPVVILLAAIIVWVLLLYPRQTNMPIVDALILAAHPDDCVITAGEYGIECLRRGRLLRVVYMTCGHRTADSEFAKLRRAEAELAWSRAGLTAQFLTFVDAPESQPDEAPAQSVAWQERIATALRDAVAQMPGGAAVILPAAAERHVDHRTLRRIALAAIRASARADLVIYEVPGYSNYISLICNPFRAVRVLLGFVPIGWRIARKITFDAPYGYYVTFGVGAMRLTADADRLRLKCEMLSAFTSQGADALITSFGRPDVFRRLQPDKASQGKELPFGLRVGYTVCTASTLLLVCSVLVSLLTVFVTFVTAVTR
jgi:LmbE family N-acetylglucosaminyl deacetylase